MSGFIRSFRSAPSLVSFTESYKSCAWMTAATKVLTRWLLLLEKDPDWMTNATRESCAQTVPQDVYLASSICWYCTSWDSGVRFIHIALTSWPPLDTCSKQKRMQFGKCWILWVVFIKSNGTWPKIMFMDELLYSRLLLTLYYEVGWGWKSSKQNEAAEAMANESWAWHNSKTAEL